MTTTHDLTPATRNPDELLALALDAAVEVVMDAATKALETDDWTAAAAIEEAVTHVLKAMAAMEGLDVDAVLEGALIAADLKAWDGVEGRSPADA